MMNLIYSKIKILNRVVKELKGIMKKTSSHIFIFYIFKLLLNLRKIIETKTLKSVDDKMEGRTCSFQVFGNKTIVLDGKYFGGAREIICREVYFCLPGFQINDEDIVVDLGANVGIFTTLAAVCGKKVISIEAQSGFIPIIKSNLEKNNCLHKCFIEFALVGGDVGALANPEVYKNASHLFEDPPVISFTEIIKKYHIKNIDFLKIDIEGSEFSLFNNDISWLNQVDRIAMEVHLAYGSETSLKKKLEQYGFEVWLVDNQQNIVNSLVGSDGYLFGKRY